MNLLLTQSGNSRVQEKYKFIAFLLAFAVLFGGFPNYAKADYKISANYIEINSVKYRRAGAESAALGSIGMKRGAFPAKFEKYKEWDFGEVSVSSPTTVDLRSESVKQLGTNAAFNLPDVGTADVRASAAENRSNDFILAKIEFSDKTELKRILNGDLKALETLKKRRGRIVTAVWILVRGTEERFRSATLGGGANLTRTNGGSMFIDGGEGRRVQFSKSTVMAYEVSSINWDHNFRGKRQSIERIDVDGKF